MEIVAAVIVAAIGSVGLFNLIQFLISRKDKKNDALEGIRKDITEIKKGIVIAEKDNCRTQMLVLMADYPLQEEEMLRLAQHYFEDLDGDWYMTSLFGKWLNLNHIERPKWFNSKGVEQ